MQQSKKTKKLSEFNIIKTYFQNRQSCRPDVVLGSGDDCALLKPEFFPGKLLAVSSDTLISGIHFPADLDSYEIGWKALAVNLSDLAAMGAEPAWFTCALTLTPFEKNAVWLKAFSQGLFDLANHYNLQLIGGDLTQGSVLSLTIGIHGYISEKLALRRSGAKTGDSIYISGKLGYPVLKNYYHRPEPKIALGLALLGKAHSAIDISDGLIADLTHILKASHKGANIYLDKIPLAHPEGLYAGDDYELCFTAPKNLSIGSYEFFCIGEIVSKPGLRIYQPDKSLYHPPISGYQHF